MQLELIIFDIRHRLYTCMRKWVILFKIIFRSVLFVSSYGSFAQNTSGDSSAELSPLHDALKVYHASLFPEPGLYNGSQYPYDVYYPFTINEGHPFFLTEHFSVGSVVYNSILYENIPLLYDIIKDKLLINDPTGRYMIILTGERVATFTIANQTFVRLKQDAVNNSGLNTGFYAVLYNGNTSLYKKVFKVLKENTASITGLNEYVVEGGEYFIKKNNQYYRITKKKSLMLVMNDNKKDVGQFMKKNRLNLKRAKDQSLSKIVSYYDSINNKSTKADN
jgi:hypothetical protein